MYDWSSNEIPWDFRDVDTIPAIPVTSESDAAFSGERPVKR